jgi:hypothetical protein
MACMAGVTAWALIASGSDGIGIIVLTGLVTLAAFAALRQRVAVQVEAITICNGLWTWHFRTDDVTRLQWIPSRQVGWPRVFAHSPKAGNLYIVRSSGRPIAVPQTNVTNVERPKGRSAAMATWFSTATSLPVEAGEVEEPDERDWG